MHLTSSKVRKTKITMRAHSNFLRSSLIEKKDIVSLLLCRTGTLSLNNLSLPTKLIKAGLTPPKSTLTFIREAVKFPMSKKLRRQSPMRLSLN